jgi:hypothetical protein
MALQVIRVHYYYYYYYYYSVGRSAPGVLVVFVPGRVAVGLMKVGSRVTNGRRGVSCKIDKPWLVHGSECVLLVGLFDLVESKLIGNGAVFTIQVRTNKQSVAETNIV